MHLIAIFSCYRIEYKVWYHIFRYIHFLHECTAWQYILPEKPAYACVYVCARVCVCVVGWLVGWLLYEIWFMKYGL